MNDPRKSSVIPRHSTAGSSLGTHFRRAGAEELVLEVAVLGLFTLAQIAILEGGAPREGLAVFHAAALCRAEGNAVPLHVLVPSQQVRLRDHGLGCEGEASRAARITGLLLDQLEEDPLALVDLPGRLGLVEAHIEPLGLRPPHRLTLQLQRKLLRGGYCNVPLDTLAHDITVDTGEVVGGLAQEDPHPVLAFLLVDDLDRNPGTLVWAILDHDLRGPANLQLRLQGCTGGGPDLNQRSQVVVHMRRGGEGGKRHNSSETQHVDCAEVWWVT